MRLRESGSERDCAAKRVDGFVQPIFRLQRETEIAPGDRMRGTQLERAPIRGDCLLVAVCRREREAEVVVELRFVRHGRDGGMQQRQRFVDAAALVQRRRRGNASPSDGPLATRQRLAVAALGAFEIAALVRREGIAHERLGRRPASCGRQPAPAPKRTVAVLVLFAAAARARFVAPVAVGCAAARSTLGEHRLRFRVIGRHREDALRDRARGIPLTHRDAVAQKLEELRRARNRGGKAGASAAISAGRHRAAEIEQAMKPERRADRIRRLERKTVGERLVGEANSVLALEHGRKRAADGRVLGFDERDARILQRAQQLARAQRKAAVADAQAIARASTTWRRCSRSRETPGPTPAD